MHLLKTFKRLGLSTFSVSLLWTSPSILLVDPPRIALGTPLRQASDGPFDASILWAVPERMTTFEVGASNRNDVILPGSRGPAPTQTYRCDQRI